jgi:hypothetical protein
VIRQDGASQSCACGGVIANDTVYAWCVDCAAEHCVHEWIIEPANGPTSNGICQRCGISRVFSNVAPTESLTSRTRGFLSRPGPGYRGLFSFPRIGDSGKVL